MYALRRQVCRGQQATNLPPQAVPGGDPLPEEGAGDELVEHDKTISWLDSMTNKTQSSMEVKVDEVNCTVPNIYLHLQSQRPQLIYRRCSTVDSAYGNEKTLWIGPPGL